MTDQLRSIDEIIAEAWKNNDIPTPHGALSLRTPDYESSLIKPLLHHEVITGEYRHQQAMNFTTDAEKEWTIEGIARHLPDDAIVERSTVVANRWITLQIKGDYWIGYLAMHGNRTEIEIFATTPTRASKVALFIREALRFTEVTENFVEFKVWTVEDDRRRRMKEQRWDDIKENYAPKTREKLSRLMALGQEEPRGGKIIIWHGEPGTGKTNALRALMTEWKWAQSEIITDPETLLTRTDYLNNLIESSNTEGKTRLLIVEDSDSLLVTEGGAGSRSPGMARLLNVADGILGVHQDLIILFTTNAPPNQLDAALSRPGRCLAHIKFNRFEAAEIKQQFGDKLEHVTTSMTLAEIWSARSEQVNIFDDSHPSKRGQYL